jgi:hypothetical protein
MSQIILSHFLSSNFCQIAIKIKILILKKNPLRIRLAIKKLFIEMNQFEKF